MVTTQTSPLTPYQVRRYSRHIIMPQVGSIGQRKLLDSKVLIIGAGGLGAAAGVITLIVTPPIVLKWGTGLLVLLIAAYSLLSSCIFPEARQALAAAGGLTALLYILNI